MTEFCESGLHFKFDESWDVCQLDQEADYRKKISKKVPDTKCIDFIGFNETQRILLFVEVKSFRGYGDHTNINRLTGEKDSLVVEIAQKVRDSLATIMGGARISTHKADKWKKYVDHLNKNKPLKIVAWVELDVSTAARLDRAKSKMKIKRDNLRKHFTWLTSDVQLLNVKNYDHKLDGVDVTLLPKKTEAQK